MRFAGLFYRKSIGQIARKVSAGLFEGIAGVGVTSDSGDLGFQLHEFGEGSQYLGFHGSDLTEG